MSSFAADPFPRTPVRAIRAETPGCIGEPNLLIHEVSMEPYTLHPRPETLNGPKY